MKKVPFILKDLSIQKMPGFSKGLKALNGLADNINIIAGANGSGKSSTARVIQQLIWRNKTKGLNVDGSVLINNEPWEIKLDSERTTIQRNGNNDEISGIPTVEGQHRYMLALHKLVEDKEHDLAKEIAKESIGGYDIDAAKSSLGYSSKVFNKSVSEYKNFHNAEKKYKEVRDQQKELKKEEETLDRLKEEKEEAQQANLLSEFYNKVTEYLEAKLKYENLSNEMKAFSDSMEKLSGKEFENIQELENQIETCQNSIEKAEEGIERSRKELEKLSIPKEGVADDTINEIDNRLDRLSSFERDIRDNSTTIAELKTQESEALKSIDSSIDPTQWQGLTINHVSGLDKMLQNAHQVLGEKEYLLSEIRMLEKEAEHYTTGNLNSETYSQGVRTLSEWLKESTNSNNGLPFWVVGAISLAGILAAVATYFVGWAGLLGLILIAILYFYAFTAKGKGSSSLSVRERDFANSGLSVPSRWDSESVASRLDELIDKLRDIKDAERLSLRLKSCKENLSKLQERIERLNVKRDEWVKKLQAAPGFPENGSNDFSSLYWFLTNVKKWQDAHSQKESTEAKLSETTKYYNDELDKINALFQKSTLKTVADVSEGKGVFKVLKNERDIQKAENRAIEQENRQIREQSSLKEKSELKLSAIYSSLGITDKNKEHVLALVNRLDDYKRISKDHYAAKQSFSEKEKLLQEHSLYNQYWTDIEYLSIDQAHERASKNRENASQLEDIQKQITSIETRIRDKKRGHELEDMLAKKDEALDNLNNLFKDNLSSATGDLIINELKRETHNQNRPPVFNRAKEIFNNITNGQYELLLGEEGEPNFKAYDTIRRLGQDLSELSTGTRVQLLLSIRLAYVETVESSIRLPLLADELLANSDDERAKAIIESLIEISRQGRQVFYFTAQNDEVDKWMHHLQKHKDLKHKIIQLDDNTDKTHDYSEFTPDLGKVSFLQKTPAPNGKNHKEYGETINPSPYNILTQNSSELHIWYLTEDVDLLYNCLKRDIKTWGQLESYYRISGTIGSLNQETFNRIQHKVEILQRFQELYQVGRSLPIDRSVLESSDAITDVFIDRVADKLNEYNHNPKQLLQALRNGEVPRFRAENADDLENYLLSKNYIDDQEILETENIIINMQALISNFDMEILEAETFINRILEYPQVTNPAKS